MISSGSVINVGSFKFKVRGFFGPYVELEMKNRANLLDGFAQERVYIPWIALLEYDKIHGSSELIRYMTQVPQDSGSKGAHREYRA